MAVPEGAVEGDDTPPVPDVVGAAPAGLPDAGMVLCCGCGNCDSCPPEARCGGVCWNLNHPLRVTGSWFASAVNPVSLPYVPGGGWWEYAAAFGPAPVTPCFCAADGSSYGYASGTAGTVSARVACLTTDSFGLRYQADVVEYGGGCCFRYVVRFWAPSGPSFVPFSCAVCGAHGATSSSISQRSVYTSSSNAAAPAAVAAAARGVSRVFGLRCKRAWLWRGACPCGNWCRCSMA
mgnify:CR=1 FL=1